MATREEIKIRQMIWMEYQAGNDIQHALISIRAKLHTNDVSESNLHHWYKRFESGETSLFDPDTEQYKIIRVIQTLPNRVEVMTFLSEHNIYPISEGLF
jgi:hypothetical protein